MSPKFIVLFATNPFPRPGISLISNGGGKEGEAAGSNREVVNLLGIKVEGENAGELAIEEPISGVVRIEIPRPLAKDVDAWIQYVCSPLRFIILRQSGSSSHGRCSDFVVEASYGNLVAGHIGLENTDRGFGE